MTMTTRSTQMSPEASALSALGEAWDDVEAARQHAYESQRLAGAGDASLVRAAHLLRAAGHPDLADQVTSQLVGRGIAANRWTFEGDETYADGYYRTLFTLQDHLRARAAGPTPLHTTLTE